jgi:hypothetical protein
MDQAVLLMALILPMVMGAAFLLGRHLQQRRQPNQELSAVTRQHIELFQGGQLGHSVIAAAKRRLAAQMEKGGWEAAEADLRPGMHYVVNVRALTEIGTDEARQILERQLQRRLTEDALEQSWYWIDLAHGLRHLHCEESLPHLLRCAEAADEAPLGHFFAAETVCFLSFGGYLHDGESPLGRAALRTLRRALEGLRFGVQPELVIEARLGEKLEDLWDHRPERTNALFVRVLVEALRQLRRAPHLTVDLGDEGLEPELAWQLGRLASLEPAIREYLTEAPEHLRRQLAASPDAAHRDLIVALDELHSEAGPELIKLTSNPDYRHAELAVRLLRWSKQPEAAAWLRALAQAREGAGSNRASSRGQIDQGLIVRRAALTALRGHPSEESEKVLVRCAQSGDASCQASALGSLGWWEPQNRPMVLQVLQAGRLHGAEDVRQAARAALARLGERQALQAFRLGLGATDQRRVFETIQIIAAEGLTLLWPELDRLADSTDLEAAYLAREALEQLREGLDGPVDH